MQQREELELLKRRINIIGYTVVVILGVLSFGLWRYQVDESAYCGELADKNRIRNVPLVAPRGQIRDRNGKVFADNGPSYDIVLIREKSLHTVQQTAEMM